MDIKIILDATTARNRYYTHQELRENGLPVKVENFGGKMHAKSMIIDDRFIVSGSMNLTKAGNSKNDENTLIIQNENLAKQYKKYFLKLWSHIPKLLKSSSNLTISSSRYLPTSTCYKNFIFFQIHSLCPVPFWQVVLAQCPKTLQLQKFYREL